MNLDPRITARVMDTLKARDNNPRPKLPSATGPRRFELVNYDDQAAELIIYDEIGWFGVSASDVAEKLAGYRGDLHVRVNSPGGDVFDGYAIYNLLAALDGTVTVTVEGVAASAASFISMAGNRIRMSLASQMMIHEASGMCYGNARDMTEMAKTLDSVSGTIAGLYAERSGAEVDGWRDAMRAETWYTPQEAVDAKLADEVVQPKRRGDNEPEPYAHNLSVFHFAGRAAAPEPEPIAKADESTAPPSEQDPETPAPPVFDHIQLRDALKEAFK